MSTKWAELVELQQLTREPRAQLLALPLLRSVTTSTLDAATRLGLLKVMLLVHEAVEEAARQLRVRSDAGLWDERWARRAALMAEIARLDAQGIPETAAEAQIRALGLGEQVQELAQAGDTAAILGALYALRGTDLASRVLQVQQERGGQGSEPETEPREDREWAPLGEVLDAALHGPADLERVVRGARLLLLGLKHAVAALPLVGEVTRVTAAALNPEAGGHVIAQEPLEVKAALQAGRITWQRFPYYEWRYGARGRRFNASDSAWLVTLSRADAATMKQQIDWLGSLLSCRGMPRWLLEQHLQILFTELARAMPERPGYYDGLLAAAQHLRESRCAQISEARFEHLWRGFDAAVDPQWRARLPEAGALLTAAVADHKAGIGRAVSSLEGWMTDPERFPSPWIAAVRATLRDAAGGQ